MAELSRDTVFEMTTGTADQVDPNIFIGGYRAAADPNYIKRNGITRIVKLFADDNSYPGGAARIPGVKYLVIPALDEPSYDISAAFRKALPFIYEGLRNNELILIHCKAGVSRSATIVIFYLMIVRKYILDEAYARLKNVRPWIKPNDGFMRHLKATDARLRPLRMYDEQWYIAPPPIYAGEAWAKVHAAERAERAKSTLAGLRKARK